jgi:hypothetical protein
MRELAHRQRPNIVTNQRNGEDDAASATDVATDGEIRLYIRGFCLIATDLEGVPLHAMTIANHFMEQITIK